MISKQNCTFKANFLAWVLGWEFPKMVIVSSVNFASWLTGIRWTTRSCRVSKRLIVFTFGSLPSQPMPASNSCNLLNTWKSGVNKKYYRFWTYSTKKENPSRFQTKPFPQGHHKSMVSNEDLITKQFTK